MMTGFYDIGSVQQVVLLVLSQLTVLLLVCGFVYMHKTGAGRSRRIATGIVFLLNVTLYALMQVNSRITGAWQGLRLRVPYVLLMMVTLLSLAYIVWIMLGETRNRKTLNKNSIKDAFDNLPTGVCFFNKGGIAVLCNLSMYRFSFDVCGRDVQYITDLEECLEDNFVPIDGVTKSGSIFVFPDGKALRLDRRAVTDEYGEPYTRFTVSDVTDLHNRQVELMAENEQLRRVQTELQRLSANVVTATREEEIMNTKMRVHDQMGRCLLAAQKYLTADNTDDIPDSVAEEWKRAVSMLKYNNDTPDEDMLLQIRRACGLLNIAFIQTGELPRSETAAYILTCAVRECVTNAVRHADATELYAEFTESDTDATVVVSNNGRPPEREISEGGGLSTLRRRVEREGGVMIIMSRPYFRMIVTVPKGLEVFL